MSPFHARLTVRPRSRRRRSRRVGAGTGEPAAWTAVCGAVPGRWSLACAIVTGCARLAGMSVPPVLLGLFGTLGYGTEADQLVAAGRTTTPSSSDQTWSPGLNVALPRTTGTSRSPAPVFALLRGFDPKAF